MRRITTVTIVSALAACSGGAHEVGQAAIHANEHPTTVATNVAPRRAAIGSDEAPTLLTLTGRGGTPTPAPVSGTTTATTATAAPSTGVPPAGGFVVRGTGAREPSAPTTVARAEGTFVAPRNGGFVTTARPTEEFRLSADATERPATVTRSDAPAHRGSPARAPSATSTGSGSVASAMRPTTARRMRAGGGHGDGGEAMPMSESAAGFGGRGMSAGDDSASRGPMAAQPHASRSVASASAGAPVPMDMMVAPPRPSTPPPPPASVTTTITITTPMPTASPIVPVDQQYVPPAGLLTAASVGDADRRENYLDYLNRHAEEAESLGLDMTRRVRFRVVDAQDHPVHDARITLSGDGVQFVAQTHADGSWDFFPSVMAQQFAGNLTARAEVENVGAQAIVNLPSRGDGQGPIVIRLPAIVQPAPPSLDLAFVLDVTGSMGDELRYVNREIGNIVHRIEAEAPGVHVRVSATFYRDRVDEAVVQQIPFTTNVAGFANMMQNVNASGGGDYPEDMNAGLEAAMTRLTWSEGPAVRAIVLVADAPPQQYADEQYTYRQAAVDASRRGIRIIPVAASGADRNVEYLFRALGTMTSTPYVYLTDDSGVGNAHMEADTDRVAVERFNDLLTRMIVSDLRGLGMHEPGPLGPPQQG